jgi:hypothetical protein
MELRVEQGELTGQVYRPDRPVVTFGRAQDCDIVLQEQGVSRQHTRLQRGPQGWAVTDLGSTNGTFVNGKRLAPQQDHALQTGDRITIGSSVLAFRETEGTHDAREPAPRSAVHPAVRVLGAVLFVAVLAGVVALLVILLQPPEQAVTPMPEGNPIEQLVTALPVPTELEGIVTAVMPLLPSGLPLFPAEPSATPDPSGDSMQGAVTEGSTTGGGP